MSGAKVRVAPLYTEENAEYWPAIYCDLSYTLANRFSTIFAPQFLYGNHLVDTYLSLPETILHTPIKDRELEIFYSAKDMNTVREILSHYDGNFYALNFGGDDGRKRYPPENYAKIVKKIVAEDSDAKFFILGEEFDRQFLDVFKNNLDEKFIEEHLIDLIGQLTYRQSGVILKFCKMYIGNDTGTMHLAAAAKCPVLVTFPFPADLKNTKWDGVKMYYPYRVPNVVVQPEKTLPECKNSDIYSPHGCKSFNVPHCITQVSPEKIFEGFKLLQERIEKNITEPLYIC